MHRCPVCTTVTESWGWAGGPGRIGVLKVWVRSVAWFRDSGQRIAMRLLYRRGDVAAPEWLRAKLRQETEGITRPEELTETTRDDAELWWLK